MYFGDGGGSGMESSSLEIEEVSPEFGEVDEEPSPLTFPTAASRILAMAGHGVSSSMESSSQSPAGVGESGGESQSMMGGGGGGGGEDGPSGPLMCDMGETYYTADRFVYARNGQAVTNILREEWCYDGTGETCGYDEDCECDEDMPFCCHDCDQTYRVYSARQFMYDSGRARYMNRVLDPEELMEGNEVALSTTWSDYDGDEIYGDFTVTSGSPPTITNVRSFEPGIGTIDPWSDSSAANTQYFHADHLGTTRIRSVANGTAGGLAIFTAFGEQPITATSYRYGYVGAWGYQTQLDTEGSVEFPYLHVGARYYDPASGRFLQRDPIGIFGGLNVHVYGSGAPTLRVDPSGLFDEKKCRGYCAGEYAKCYASDPDDTENVTLCIGNNNGCLTNCECKQTEVDAGYSGDPGDPPYPNLNDPDQWDPWPGVGLPDGGVGDDEGACGATGIEAAPFLWLCLWIQCRRRSCRSNMNGAAGTGHAKRGDS